jgi:hypothetical protein
MKTLEQGILLPIQLSKENLRLLLTILDSAQSHYYRFDGRRGRGRRLVTRAFDRFEHGAIGRT